MNFKKVKKHVFSLKKVAAAAFMFLSLSGISFSAETKKETTTITIINAQSSGNRKDPFTNDDVLEFEGSVKISVVKTDTKAIISADKITYNRARDMLYAEGNVSLDQTDKNGSVSTVSADTLLFNTVTLEGVFDNSRVTQAQSNAINLPSGSTLNVASDIFARDDSGTIAFKSGALTFCNDENPHWTIRATRIWLLPGNEFAFFNAVVFVGKVPVLYLPAFYYPKDELVFNPVFGYRNRTGYFVQTTLYLLGRKPLEENKDSKENDDSILGDYYSLIKPSKLMDQKLEGIVLHNLDTEYKGDTSTYLKLMTDWYSNLGVGVGLEGQFKPKMVFNDIYFSTMLGFSNTVFQSDDLLYYMPYAPSGKKYEDKSNFMGVELPFRYRAELRLRGSSPVNFSFSIPIYSDPFFAYDFSDRSETMDWFSYLMNNPTAENSSSTELDRLNAAEISSFQWDGSISYSVPLRDGIKPYISNLSISSFTSNIVFNSINAQLDTVKDTDGWSNFTPERKFFYPSSITPAKITTQISGTIYSTDIRRKTKKSKLEVPLVQYPEFVLEEGPVLADEETESQNDSEFEGIEIEGLALTELSVTAPEIKDLSVISYSLGYSLSPAFSSQYSYASNPLKKADDFRWDRLKSSYIQVKAPLTLNQSLGYKNEFLGMRNTFLLDNSYQEHPYISDNIEDGGYTEAGRKSLVKTDYNASYVNLTNTNALSFKPFILFPHFKNTGLTYNTTIKWFRSEFKGDADDPKWDMLSADWSDENSITSHNLDMMIAATEFEDKVGQSLSLRANLPPQIDEYYSILNLFVPHVSFTAESGFKKKSKLIDEWVKEPFKQGLTVSFFNNSLKFSESYNYELEEDHPESMKLAIDWKNFQASYVMRYTIPYDFDQEKGWIAKTEKEYLPYTFSLSFASGDKKITAWKKRVYVQPGLSTSIAYDFIRPTSSYFIFSPSLTFKINKFFNITFSATSRNDVLYRYFQTAAGYPGRIPGEENMFTDLMNSFRFDDEKLRQSSGFKLKSLNVMISHDLHDWDFRCQFKVEPRLVTKNNIKSYDFSPFFTMSVVWRPMDSIKAKIVDEYGTVTLNGEESTSSK